MVAFARRMNPPENEIPAAVAISALLARTEDVAIALIGAQAYTFGLRFDLVIRLRQEPRDAMAHKLHGLLAGHPGLEDSDERLLLGVEYADGRTVTNLRSFGFRGLRADADPDEPVAVADWWGRWWAFVRPVVLVDTTAARRSAGRGLRLVRAEHPRVPDGAGRCRHCGSGISRDGAVAAVAAVGRGTRRTTRAAGPRGRLVRQGQPAGHRLIRGPTDRGSPPYVESSG